MFGSHIEIRGSSIGRRVYLVHWTAVAAVPGDPSGRFAVRLGESGGRTQIVPWHAVRRPSHQEATQLLRASFGAAWGSASAIASRLGLALRDEQRMIEQVVALLVGGTYVLVEIEAEDIPLGHFVTRSPPPEPRPPDAPRPPPPRPSGRCRHGCRRAGPSPGRRARRRRRVREIGRAHV